MLIKLSIQLNQQLIMAYEDYKYLLNRGYNRKPALDLVTARYNLSKKERLLLYRCTHSNKEIEEVKRKIVINPSEIAIDGYNIAITLLSAIYEDEIFLCDDGFYRDLGLGKRKNDPEILEALILVNEYLSHKDIKSIILLDSQISKSGELASKLRKLGINVEVVNKTDKILLLRKEVIVSNDFLILNKAERVYDLLGEIIGNIWNIKVFKIPPT